MIYTVFWRLLALVLLLGGSVGCASQSLEPPLTTHGYRVSFDTADRTLWLGPQALGDPRPNTTVLVVVVRDAQGQRLDGIAVEFAVEPSWLEHVTIVPQSVYTQAGIARAVFEPRLTGTVHVLAQVDGRTYTRRLHVVVRNFGNNER